MSTSTTTTKTPVYLENVIYFFEKWDAYNKSTFVMKNDQAGQTVDITPISNALLQIKDVLSNTATASVDIVTINNLIDDYLDAKFNNADSELDQYFDDKNATLNAV